MGLVGGVSGARRTALVVPPCEIIMLARSPRSLAHDEDEAPGSRLIDDSKGPDDLISLPPMRIVENEDHV